MRRGLWMLAAELALVTPAGAQEMGEDLRPCGVPDADAHADVVHLLTDPERAAHRARMELTGLEPAHLVALSDDEGATAICAQLRATLSPSVRADGPSAPMAATMYRVGSRYIVAVRSRPIVEDPPQPRGPDQTISYTLDFEPIGAVIR